MPGISISFRAESFSLTLAAVAGDYKHNVDQHQTNLTRVLFIVLGIFFNDFDGDTDVKHLLPLCTLSSVLSCAICCVERRW